MAATATPVDRSRVAHNTLLNMAGLAVPLALAFFVMPIAARYLGPARFGLLGLAWAVTEYLSLFDLGLGRATVKFVADAMQRQQEDLSDIVALSTLIQLVAGIVGGAAFALAAPKLVPVAFHLPPTVESEAIAMFRVVGLNLPAVLLLSGLRGVLEGAQRFDLSNGIRMLSSAASVAIPAIGAVQGASLPDIMWWVLISRVIVCVLYVVAIHSAIRGLAWRLPRAWSRARDLLSFGGWVLVSNVVSPLLVYFDRFALGAIAGVAAVGFYTAPYEGVTRLLLVAVSVALSLLPTLTSLESAGERTRGRELVASSGRSLMIVMAIPLAIIFAFAPVLVQIWLGPTYAAQSSTALRILSIGVFANSLTQLPLVTLYAVHRPDLPAKFHVTELLIHVPLTLILVRRLGIVGAATAWTTRASLDLALMLAGSARATKTPFGSLMGGLTLRAAVCIFALAALLSAAAALISVAPSLSLLVAAGVLVAFIVVSWRWVLTVDERAAIGRLARIYLRPMRTSAGSVA